MRYTIPIVSAVLFLAGFMVAAPHIFSVDTVAAIQGEAPGCNIPGFFEQVGVPRKYVQTYQHNRVNPNWLNVRLSTEQKLWTSPEEIGVYFVAGDTYVKLAPENGNIPTFPLRNFAIDIEKCKGGSQ